MNKMCLGRHEACPSPRPSLSREPLFSSNITSSPLDNEDTIAYDMRMNTMYPFHVIKSNEEQQAMYDTGVPLDSKQHT